MSNLIHCDGPDCERTQNPDVDRRALCQLPWLTLEQGDDRYDFHHRDCLVRWAVPPEIRDAISELAQAELDRQGGVS